MPRPELSEIELIDTRERLCEAALTLYKKQGVEAVTFRRLAKQTGSSHTHAYRYFADKQSLFAAMRLHCYRRFYQLIREHDTPASGPAERMQRIHAGIMRFVQAEPAEYQLMFSMHQPALGDYPELLRVRRAAFDYLVAIVQDAVDLDLMQGDARTIMHIAWGAVHGLLSLHTAGQLVHERKLDELTQPLLARVLHPLYETHSANSAARKSA